jgi:murein L,D-transpeptidase YafK
MKLLYGSGTLTGRLDIMQPRIGLPRMRVRAGSPTRSLGPGTARLRHAPLRLATLAIAIAIAAALHAEPAGAVSIELKDVASDRVERQRAAAEGNLPLAGTPDLSRLSDRLAEKGLSLGSPVLLRAFKSESEFEVWIRKDDTYVLFATYPVCHWSGTIGPKLREGDKQTPEGFYTVTRTQMRHVGRWPRSMNLGFPNVYDKAQARSGSHILVHGGCSSVGCFAMTNSVVEEIYGMTERAIAGGQTFIPVHVFPFRMTDANLASQKDSPWHSFWANLKEGHDFVERTKRPPRISVCDNRYRFHDMVLGEGTEPGPLEACGATHAALRALEQLSPAALTQLSLQMNPPVPGMRSLPANAHLYLNSPKPNARAAGQPRLPDRRALHAPRPGQLRAALEQRTATSPSAPCSTQRASCRRYLALQEQATSRRAASAARKRVQQAAR